jgi:hypothetical protein|tara:strand:- start:3109 stop:3300 length:192 start_codon:yes stop_codon:yes gene_type:complete
MSGNQTNITVQDLKTIHYIINIAAKEGIIEPKDMTRVGAVYEKVELTINNITSKHAEEKKNEE